MYNIIRILVAAGLLSASLPGAGWEILNDDLSLVCDQGPPPVLNCDYRPLTPAAGARASARTDSVSLAVNGPLAYPQPGSISAVLFLVDTSDPGRQNVIDRNMEHIQKILQAAQPHHRFGLASFDKELVIQAPVGSAPDRVASMARQLRATGRTTELYRNVIKAIAAVAAVAADRKAIILFSDGQAEDRAYFHQDVIRAASRGNVIINSLGYPRTVSLSVALQTIRRLSEESGGIYVETDAGFNLPAAYLADPFANIDAGGKLTVDLAPILTAAAPGSLQLTLTLESAAGSSSVHVPVSNPQSAASVAVEAAAPAPAAAAVDSGQPAAIRILAPVQDAEEIDVWLWYGIPVAFGILIMLTLIILGITYYQFRTPARASAKPAPATHKPFAYLVVQDESGLRYPITNTTWRIGRTRDNELTLDDKSVSRRHAEIQRYSNGKFVIFDVDSLNGVFVNSEQVKKKKLEEGDIIEIGDIYMRFTTRAADYPLDEDTVLQNTRTPKAN
jgi:hypothetical protein